MFFFSPKCGDIITYKVDKKKDPKYKVGQAIQVCGGYNPSYAFTLSEDKQLIVAERFCLPFLKTVIYTLITREIDDNGSLTRSYEILNSGCDTEN